MAVMVGAGFGVGMDGHGARPELFRADAGEVDGGSAGHAGGLGSVCVEGVRGNDGDAVVLPGEIGSLGTRIGCAGCLSIFRHIFMERESSLGYKIWVFMSKELQASRKR